MPPYFLRLAYITEFLLAILTTMEMWSQVGGQGHLDLMPWYVKFGCVIALAAAIVAATVSAVGHERAWNAKTIASALIALLIVAGMGAVTYYYHLHESDDSADDDSTLTLLWQPGSAV